MNSEHFPRSSRFFLGEDWAQELSAFLHVPLITREESTLSCHLEEERSVLQAGFLNHDLHFLSAS